MRRLFLVLCVAAPLLAQAPKPAQEEGIQDNSFLVEEAYNQDPGVVQHISTWQRDRRTAEWVGTFTQEWPAGGQAHQLSFSLPYQRLADSPGAFRTGVGDVALNYRYQLLGDGEARVAVAPRLSVYLPTGDAKRGFGRGAAAYEVGVPISLVLSEHFAAHTNLSAIAAPKAQDADGNRADTRGWGVGQSLVWLAHPRFNLMLEWTCRDDGAVSGPGSVTRKRTAWLSPGIRWAHNFPSGLQIVPGLALPIGVGPSRGERAAFLYLSFEHPFGRRR